jgi:hypothetical protein
LKAGLELTSILIISMLSNILGWPETGGAISCSFT